MKEQYSAEELIQAILKGGTDRQRAIRFIYKDKAYKQKVINYVKINSGSGQDGEDMFHEGIIVLDRNIRNGKFRGESSLSVYLFSICKFLWMNQIRKRSKVDLVEDTMQLDEVDSSTPEGDFLAEEKKDLLRKVLDQLGEKCKRILELWRLSYSMEEIANELNLSSAALARKHKYKCHKALVQFIHDNPKLVDLLK